MGARVEVLEEVGGVKGLEKAGRVGKVKGRGVGVLGGVKGGSVGI